MSVTWELTRPKFSDQGLNLGHHSESVFSAWGNNLFYCYQFSSSSVQSLSHVRLFVTPWTAGRQASLSITNSRSLPKLTTEVTQQQHVHRVGDAIQPSHPLPSPSPPAPNPSQHQGLFQ